MAIKATMATSEMERPAAARSAVDLLSSILWREREILRHIVAVAYTDRDDAELALRSLGSLELHRAILTREVAADHQLTGEPVLDDLLPHLAPEWQAMLAGHRRALRSLVADVDEALHEVVFPLRIDDGGVHGTARAAQARAAVQRSLVDFLG